jgi:hypothetical protein
VIPYHGGPITPEPCAFRAWRGRHAFISWFEPRQIDLAASCCQSFALDNGAYSFWKRQQEEGAPPPHWPDYYDWCATWLRHRACDWAVIPDVIGGTEEENDALLAEWPFGHRGVPVWHLQESVDRLVRLASAWPRIALGSAAEYDVKRPAKAVDRLRDVGSAISDDGVPRVKLHGLRMLNPAIIEHVPLSSADSTNLARNIGIHKAWGGPYSPASLETRVDVLVERIERTPVPDRFSNVVQPAFALEAT